MRNEAPPLMDEQLIEEASSWISRLDRGLTESERVLLDEFFHKPGARQMFLEMAKMSDQLNSLRALAGDLPEKPPARHLTRSWQAMAAMLAVSITIALAVVYLNSGPGPARDPALEVVVYETHVGEQSVVKLEDGSDVALNTGTTLRVTFTDSGRLAVLMGEAFFDVASDPYRPFSVIAGDHLIQAVGTSFSVYNPSRGPLEVIVQEGKVRVKADSPVALTQSDEAIAPPMLIVGGSALEAGQLGLFTGDVEEVTEIGSDQVAAKLSWREGKLVFRGESLENALADISRYTTTRFEFLDEDAKSIAVAGVFQSGDVDGLLQTLSANFGITYQRLNDDHILISRR